MQNRQATSVIEKMKIALVMSVVAQDNPTVAVLHKTLMEEFGQRADSKLVDFFHKELKKKERLTEELSRSVGESALDLVRSVATGPDPTVEKLHQLFQEKRGEKASTALVAFFRAELRKRSLLKAGVRVADGKSKIELLRSVVAASEPTLKKLKDAFFKEFGITVPPELITVFNLEIQKKEAAAAGLTLAEYLVRQVKERQRFQTPPFGTSTGNGSTKR